jgi:hypothetical protein
MTPIDIAGAEEWGRRGSSGRDRREAERVIAYWEAKLNEHGGEASVAALELGRINSEEWAHRFLIAVDRVIERSSLLLYGAKFAQLVQLPQRPRPDRPMLRQLPARYGEVFLDGCAKAQAEMAPVRTEGEVERNDGRIELYRAGFIPVAVKPRALTCFAFGAFNSRIFEPAVAA